MATALRPACVTLIGISLFFGDCRNSCSASTWTTLIWDRVGCTIQVPSGWREHPERETKGRYVAVDDASGENVVVTLPFKVDPPSDLSAPNAFEKIAAQLEEVARTESSYKRISFEIGKLDGMPAIDWWYQVEVDGVRRLHGQRLVFRGDTRLMASVSSTDLESPRVKRVIESFRLVQAPDGHQNGNRRRKP